MKVAAIIPARYASQRLPGKALLEIAGKPMIQHVYERVSQSDALNSVVVATDDERIAEAVKAIDGHVVMTSPDHCSGTDRVAEAAAELDADIVINVQGDEPLFDAKMIDDALAPFHKNSDLLFGTLRAKIRETDDIFDTNVVKVVVDQNDFALYFSRSPIPFARGIMRLKGNRPGFECPANERPDFFKHLGLYVYRRDFLLEYHKWAPGVLECIEKLEQLRALEHGVRIMCPLTQYDTISVDTPNDLQRVRNIFANGIH